MKKLFISLFLALFVCSLYSCQSPANESKKPRILISTDVGGTDPDDNQSIIHLLMYTDLFNLEGLVSSPSYGNGSKEEILRMIDLYEKDFPKLVKHAPELMHPDSLRPLCKQGARGAVAFKGVRSVSTEGSEWIVQCARRQSEQPLWVLVWGGLDDVAQALHDAPDIQDKIRVYWIGGPNKKWSVNSYTYIVQNFPNLWIIENNASYRGFIADKKVNDKYNAGCYETFLKGAGHSGEDFINYYQGLPKMGDTPSLLYLMHGDPNDPMGESWGGSFEPLKRSPYIVFDRPTTAKDTIPVYSVIEFRIKGPIVENIPSDSTCFTLDIGNQKWGGYYLGEGNYAVRHSTYYTRTLDYTITSDIPGFPNQQGAITVKNIWPDKPNTNDLTLGNHWYTDKADSSLFYGKHQGAMTVYKWRKEVIEDWGKRWNWLKE